MIPENASGSLGEFLRARRSRLVPDETDLRMGRRRVRGLRREELAARAGLSTPYYARLEQGTSRNASPAVLNSLARAMNLSDDERRHLYNLAVVDDDRPTRAGSTEQLAAPLAQLLPALADTPALVLGRAMDILAWNSLGHALVALHLNPNSVDSDTTRPNSARLAFLDPATARLYPDRNRKMRAVVGHLRLSAGRHPHDSRLQTVVNELTRESEEFEQLWADHAVASCDGASYTLLHPEVGAIDVDQQTLSPLLATDQTLVTFTPAPGSASARRRFAQLRNSHATETPSTGDHR